MKVIKNNLRPKILISKLSSLKKDDLWSFAQKLSNNELSKSHIKYLIMEFRDSKKIELRKVIIFILIWQKLSPIRFFLEILKSDEKLIFKDFAAEGVGYYFNSKYKKRKKLYDESIRALRRNLKTDSLLLVASCSFALAEMRDINSLPYIISARNRLFTGKYSRKRQLLELIQSSIQTLEEHRLSK